MDFAKHSYPFCNSEKGYHYDRSNIIKKKSVLLFRIADPDVGYLC